MVKKMAPEDFKAMMERSPKETPHVQSEATSTGMTSSRPGPKPGRKTKKVRYNFSLNPRIREMLEDVAATYNSQELEDSTWSSSSVLEKLIKDEYKRLFK